MELTKEHIDGLLAKYFSGEALPEEALLLDEWKHASADNLQYYRECEAAFAATGSYVHVSPDTGRMYEKLHMLIDDRPKRAKVIPLHPYRRLARVAAVIAMIGIAGLLAAVFLRTGEEGSEVMIASGAHAQQQKLDDGTQVFLNKGALLALAGSFNKKERKLKLTGEAFFEVVHDAAKPFIIEANGVFIRDVGTAFNVNALPGSDSVTVLVTEGIVDMYTGTQSVQLHAQQSAVYVRSADRIIEIPAPATHNAIAYKTRDFHFKANTLEEVVAALNAVYDEQIVLEHGQLGACRITVDFYHEPIETVVTIIAETLNLRFEKTNEGYLLKGTTCMQ